MEWVLIFLAGVVLDVISTMYLRAVAKKDTFSAARMTFLSELISLMAFITILDKLNGNAGLSASTPYILDYSLGAAVGTMLVMSDKERLKEAIKTTAMYLF